MKISITTVLPFLLAGQLFAEPPASPAAQVAPAAEAAPASGTETIPSLIAAHQDLDKAWVAKIRGTKTKAEQAELLKVRPNPKAVTEKVVALLKKSDSLDDLKAAIAFCVQSPTVDDTVMDMAREKLIDSPEITMLVYRTAADKKNRTEAGEALLKAAAASKDDNVQASLEFVEVNEAQRTDETKFVELATEFLKKHPKFAINGRDMGKFMEQELNVIKNFALGKAAPEIEGEDVDGKKMKLSDYKGKVVVLDFWGIWWGPCVQMIPHERSLVERLKDQPFVLLGINSDPKEKLKAAMAEHKITWPSFWDGGGTGGPIATAWGVTGWPTIYVLDHKGIIRYKSVRGPEMDEAVDKLLAEMTSDKS